MSVQPVLPFGGYAGWRYLQRTLDTQQARLQTSPAAKRDEAYFREKIGSVTTAAALVKDRRLLTVALGAFGLDKDINSTYFVRKVLEEGTLSPGSLANKLSDKSYAAMADAFGFDLSTPNTQISTFADKILTAYKTRKFESAVGDQDNDMRLALNAQRELSQLAGKSSSDTTKWYTIMGSTPLRTVFETAFSLPSSFATLDLDRQLATLRNRADTMFGATTVSQFSEPKALDRLIKTFLVKSATTAAPTMSASPALSLLQSSGSATSILQILMR